MLSLRVFTEYCSGQSHCDTRGMTMPIAIAARRALCPLTKRGCRSRWGAFSLRASAASLASTAAVPTMGAATAGSGESESESELSHSLRPGRELMEERGVS